MKQEVQGISHSAPYIVITGIPEEDNTQFFVCSEQRLLLESDTLRDAMLDMIAAYFVFDISYPKSTSPALIFIQHKVLGLQDDQPVPLAAAKLIGNFNMLD